MNSSLNNVDRNVHSPIVKPSIHSVKSWIAQYGEGAAALLSGLLIAVAWLLGNVSDTASVLVYLLAFIVGGFAKAKEGLETLIQERDLDVNLLMIVAAIGAACIGYWAEGAVLIFIFSLSGALESYTMARSHRDISSLMELKPETAVLYTDGQETVVPIEQLSVGDTVIVKPGERIPSDGVVKGGASAVNQASITGESVPVDKVAGDGVYAGTLNGQGILFVEVTQTSESSLFAKIIRLVQEAQSEKPASQRFIERFERIYARVIIAGTLLLVLVPPVLSAVSWSDAFYKAMVFLVVASPCALVASIMPAVLSAVSNGARQGLLVKGGAHLEHLANTAVVAFDKTGTLTEGKPAVTDVVAFRSYTEEQVLEIAASIESFSEHPLAKAVVQHAAERKLEVGRPDRFTSLTGFGVEADYKGGTWTIGKPEWTDAETREAEVTAAVHELEQQGKTVVVLRGSEGPAGLIAMQDRIRPQAAAVVARLKQMGIKVAMLTGDQERTAQAVAREAGIDLVYARLLPEEKVARIKELRQTYGKVAMVGDGVNDAPALAAATTGIAMGGAGSDSALETADIVLMNDDTRNIATAIALGQKTKKIIKQNLVFSISVIVLLIAANFLQGIALPLGVVGHEGSTILVILNGLRLLRGVPDRFASGE
ncbi:heavy metal translocating P-type ATPase [Paenibacillus oceani]|uniref:Cadmium-translocating P-type ATPase n=1 Tax=Paenibacillus oceani TaxID=2772510 RepID=A0A927GZZ6_9BACL|nr:heavy metal translocating P-type ATPase [Paenibacillus oceani]MBD2861964.1 cadmium-translocating P-type ATPase [Paenibacillus oceani]